MKDRLQLDILADQKLGQMNRRNFLRAAGLGVGIAAVSPVAQAQVAAPGASGQVIPPIVSLKPKKKVKYKHHLPAIPATSVDGYFSAEQAPVMRIDSGDTVLYDTVNMAGVPRSFDPGSFFREHNIPQDDEVIRDMIAIRREVPPSGVRGHLLTGPLYINEAEPGDILEVRVHDIDIRTIYGVNNGRPGGGGLPDHVKERWSTPIFFDEKKQFALFNDEIHIPLDPFLGVMGVAPAPGSGRLSSIPPYSNLAGNLDNRRLNIGSTLYIPVQTRGALFQTGDGHSVQGNGEVSGTAIETGLQATLQFIVHKAEKPLTSPLGETKDHFITHGIDWELSIAMRKALEQACLFLVDRFGLTFNQSLSLCSTVVDFEITQIVNGAKGVHGMIPKNIFRKEIPYWI
jgi:acetamidase/formamidase